MANRTTSSHARQTRLNFNAIASFWHTLLSPAMPVAEPLPMAFSTVSQTDATGCIGVSNAENINYPDFGCRCGVAGLLVSAVLARTANPDAGFGGQPSRSPWQTAVAEQSPPTITVVPTARPALARPTPQPNGTGCSIGGRPVSCEVFRDHTINESIDDFTGLDCEAMANIAVLRMEGWALAESMGPSITQRGTVSWLRHQLRRGLSGMWKQQGVASLSVRLSAKR